MKKLLFVLALLPTMALADGYMDKEDSPVWLKREHKMSVVRKKKTTNTKSEPKDLFKVLDQQNGKSVQKNNESTGFAFSPYAAIKLGYGQYKGDAKVDFAATPTDNQKDDYSAGTMALSLAFGVRLNDFRVELEGKTDTGSKDTKLFGHDGMNGKLYTAALMGNVYYDVPLKSQFRPYVGAGLGAAHVKGNIYGISHSETNLSWQVMAGIGYDLTEHWKIDLGYNYISYGDVTIGETPDIDVKLKDIKAHNITLGTRYEF